MSNNYLTPTPTITEINRLNRVAVINVIFNIFVNFKIDIFLLVLTKYEVN